MPWARLDDSFDAHHKVRRAGLEATGLWARSLSHAAGALRDGHIDQVWVEERAGKRAAKLGEMLVVAGLWEPNGDGWVIHDYLEYNASREAVLMKRAAEAEWKIPGLLRQFIFARDEGVCRLCGQPVEGQFHVDHIQPASLGGPTVPENLQLAHPSCNVRKGNRI